MAKIKVKIILDTNWYVSAIINQRSRQQIFELLNDVSFTIIISNEIISEFNKVIQREKFKKIINQEQITKFMNLLIAKTEHIKIESELRGSRDINDNFLLSLSFDSKADYLITGDSDLLVLEKSGTTQIITLSDFLKIISPPTQ